MVSRLIDCQYLQPQSQPVSRTAPAVTSSGADHGTASFLRRAKITMSSALSIVIRSKDPGHTAKDGHREIMRIQILHIRRHVDIEKPQCDVFERLHLVLSRSRCLVSGPEC